MRFLPTLAIALALTVSACAAEGPASGSRKAVSTSPRIDAWVQIGMASWYGPGFAGKLTANGERFDPDEMTCAHPKLPFNTRVEVTNLANGKTVVVRVNDRGPYAKKRVIDLSKEAAKRLGFLDEGTAKVRIEVLAATAEK